MSAHLLPVFIAVSGDRRASSTGPAAAACEHGAALIAALMITSVVGALAACLAFVVITESRIGRYHQSAASGAYAAVAGVERLIGEVRRLPDWRPLPSTSSPLAEFNDGRGIAVLPDGTSLDLARLTASRQTASDAFYPAAADRPVWRLYAHAALTRVISSDAAPPDPYIIVWVADDADETDGDPAHDSNGVILARAEAFGVRGAWQAVEATLAASAVRDEAGVAVMSTVTVVAWREAR